MHGMEQFPIPKEREMLYAPVAMTTGSEPQARSTAEPPFSGESLRPRLIAVACIVVLAGLGWIYLGLMVGQGSHSGHGGALGPGMGLVDLIVAGRLDAVGRALVEALCQPSFAQAGAANAGGHGGMGPWRVEDAALVYLMWAAMTFAMMLPTAAPMVFAAAEIAAKQRERAVSPLILAVGYMSVWLCFAAVATGLQWLLLRLAILDPALVSASTLFSGAIFIGAGVYQFSALKHACVTVCQRPFPYLSARWSGEPRAAFRLGVEQGLFCLGCCWAMMLVTFAVGVMNVIWMAVLGAVMAVEKITATTRFSHAIGVVFLAIGVAFVVSSVMAHWPARAG
jgi:predicted metal-binding membrane protein